MPDAEAQCEDILRGMWRGSNVASAPQCGTGTVPSRVVCSARCVAVSRPARRSSEGACADERCWLDHHQRTP